MYVGSSNSLQHSQYFLMFQLEIKKEQILRLLPCNVTLKQVAHHHLGEKYQQNIDDYQNNSKRLELI